MQNGSVMKIPEQLMPHSQSDLNEDEFYRELTSRNRHFVSPESQARLRQFKILIAGCGSTGGACVEPLVRLGVSHFWLADNGRYELNNLNRQHAKLENIDQNKAQFHADEILAINPHADVKWSPDGITPRNVEEFTAEVDLVFDAVDVTTTNGIRAKVLLHEKCRERGVPVLSGLDLGYVQWGCVFDYRDPKLKSLNGKASAVLAAAHPIAALFQMFPLKIIPGHTFKLVEDLLEGRCEFASQMGCTSDALSAVIVPAVIKFVETGDLIKEWKIDLSIYRYTKAERLRYWWTGIRSRRRLKKLLSARRS